MRLYNTYFICKNLYESLNGVEIKRNASNPKVCTISNWLNYKEALMALRKIPIFKNEVDNIYNIIPVFVREKNTPSIDADIMGIFQTQNKALCSRVRTVIELYESMNLNGNKQGIDVKIPSSKDLKDYISNLKDIDFIFTQCPYLLSKDEKIEFDSVDVGSNWLNFVVAVTAGAPLAFYILRNLALLLDKAMILKSHYTTIKAQEESLKIAQKKTELAFSEIEIFETLKKHYMQEAINELKEQISPVKDGEEEGKVEKSLEKLVGLLDKGVEIYASLDSPKDVQVLFPPIDETNSLPESVLQFIEDKNRAE